MATCKTKTTKFAFVKKWDSVATNTPSAIQRNSESITVALMLLPIPLFRVLHVRWIILSSSLPALAVHWLMLRTDIVANFLTILPLLHWIHQSKIAHHLSLWVWSLALKDGADPD